MVETESWSIDSSTCLAAPESLDYHFARSGEGFLSMRREYRKHAAQKRILGGAEMVEDIGETLDPRPHVGRWLLLIDEDAQFEVRPRQPAEEALFRELERVRDQQSACQVGMAACPLRTEEVPTML